MPGGSTHQSAIIIDNRRWWQPVVAMESGRNHSGV